MPLVTRTATAGNHYTQAAAPASPLAGDLWTDIDADLTYRRDDANANWVLIATHADVSNAEYGYLDGVTSALQTQINAKAATSGATLTSCTLTSPTINSPTITTPSITGGLDIKPLRQTFEDWFAYAGVTVNVPNSSQYTFTNTAGVGTGAITDGIGKGFRITSGATSGNSSNISLNNIRHFDPDNCTVYGIIAIGSDVNLTMRCGLSNNTGTAAGDSFAVFEYNEGGGSATFFGLGHRDGVDGGSDATDVTGTTAVTPFKIIAGASNIKLYLIVAGVWTLKVTYSGANRPTAACQPYFQCSTNTTGAKFAEIMYLRAENDS